MVENAIQIGKPEISTGRHQTTGARKAHMVNCGDQAPQLHHELRLFEKREGRATKGVEVAQVSQSQPMMVQSTRIITRPGRAIRQEYRSHLESRATRGVNAGRW